MVDAAGRLTRAHGAQRKAAPSDGRADFADAVADDPVLAQGLAARLAWPALARWERGHVHARVWVGTSSVGASEGEQDAAVKEDRDEGAVAQFTLLTALTDAEFAPPVGALARGSAALLQVGERYSRRSGVVLRALLMYRPAAATPSA